MESSRQSKLAKQIQKDLSDIIIPMSKQLASGKMLTVTRVRMTPDLGQAKAYISVFPSDDSENIVSIFNTHAGQIRYELGQKLRHQVKKIPELKFFLDDSLDYLDNIDNLLK
ncbi:MAG: 30S ribosome-binding factor RbfA [Bacteroidales bacterium]|nr:30S ribosome-binding factor RbfA [Bacteroidales bacterium]MBN2820826.1 30S ribosome-binding factor RbfA [Bacteroidales bacterium]